MFSKKQLNNCDMALFVHQSKEMGSDGKVYKADSKWFEYWYCPLHAVMEFLVCLSLHNSATMTLADFQFKVTLGWTSLLQNSTLAFFPSTNDDLADVLELLENIDDLALTVTTTECSGKR